MSVLEKCDNERDNTELPFLLSTQKLKLINFLLQGPEDPKPSYSFEMTTSFFTIDNNGYLIVNVENLDRDPPSPGTFRFQVLVTQHSSCYIITLTYAKVWVKTPGMLIHLLFSLPH
jgi:hypothetical protein